MNKKPFPPTAWPNASLLAATLGLGLILTLSSGCKQDVVHQRSVAELNQKAQTMMQSGDLEGAISRLEAAHDLDPAEPNTTYNLAIAYQTRGDFPKAIAIFNQLLEKPGADGTPMSAPEIHKAMGITYEAEADKLDADAKAAEADPKKDKAKASLLSQQAAVALQQALMHYQKALPGLKNSTVIANQIQAIETKLKKANGGAQP
jgi:tetratricopeptide (TPR) repeat protein